MLFLKQGINIFLRPEKEEERSAPVLVSKLALLVSRQSNQFYEKVPEVLPCNTKLHITCPSATLSKETMHTATYLLCFVVQRFL